MNKKVRHKCNQHNSGSNRRYSQWEMVILVMMKIVKTRADLCMARSCPPDAINFMARLGRGLICLTITRRLAHKLIFTDG